MTKQTGYTASVYGSSFLSFFLFSLNPSLHVIKLLLTSSLPLSLSSSCCLHSLCHLLCPHFLSPLSKTLFFTIPLSQAFHRWLGSWPAKERKKAQVSGPAAVYFESRHYGAVDLNYSFPSEMQPRNHLCENDKELTEGGVHVGICTDCMAAGLQTGATLNLNRYH